MRVLYLTDSLSDLDGVGRYTVDLITALEKLRPGIEVEVLLARKHRPTSARVPAHWRVRVALPPDYFFYMSASRFWPSLSLAAFAVAKSAGRADLVHAIKDYPHSFAGLLGARARRKPCVATAHGTYSIQPLLDPRHRKLARWCYPRFASVIAVSRYTARRIFEEMPDGALARENVHVIPNAVDSTPFASRPDVGDRPWQHVEYTLSIGETKERKGHHLALAGWCAVASRHPALHHFVVGKLSGDAYAAGLMETVTKAGLESRVHFLGNVSEAEKVDLLQRALVFVHTPVTAADGGFEGFGIVYMEAAAAGVASVGTRKSGAEDAIVDGVTGLLVEPDPAAVERALERLLGDAELRARMASAGRAHAERASWAENARAVLAVYDRALR